MRILVTGATGFVGACVARRLVLSGHEVHVTTRVDSNCWRLSGLLNDLRLHYCDLRDEEKVTGLVLQSRPEAIFHMATYGGYSVQQDSLTTFQTNFLGTMNLVRACEKIDYTCFINTGSSSEYGLKSHPMAEIDLLEPRGDYGVTKAATTLFCRSEAMTKGLPIATFRIFSPYGPWDDPKRMIPYVISCKLQGVAPRLSNPAFIRDYIHIDDVVAAYEAALAVPITPGEILNIGSGVQHSLGEVVGSIDELLPNDPPLWGATEAKRDEPTCWVADITRARATLRWQPGVELRTGLRDTVEWMREHSGYYSVHG